MQQKEKMRKNKNKPVQSGAEELIPKLRFPEFKDKGEWKIKLLGKIALITTGSSNREDSNLDGKYTFFDRSQDIRNSNRYLFDKEAVIVPGEGQEFTPKYFEGKFDLHQRTYAIFDFINTDGKYLFYFISQNDNYLLSQAVGSTVKSLRLPMFETMPIVVPKPQEQQKIASCLSSLDEVIEAHSQKLELLKDHKKGLMQNLFPQEGEKVPKYRFPEFRNEGEWVEKKLGDVAEIITGNTPSTKEIENYNGEKLFVSPADINDNRFITQTKTTLTELGFSKTRHIEANSVLFVCIGSTIGKIAQNKVECATNQQINSLIPFKEYSSGFLYSALENSVAQISELAGIQAVPIINKVSLRATTSLSFL